MRNFKLYISILALSFILINCKKETKPSENKNSKDQKEYVITQGKHCFLSTIKSPIVKGKDTIYETNQLLLNCNIEGNKVTGNYDYIPYKQDAIRGTFEGILENNVITSICNNPNNNRKKEEFIFKIEKDKVSIFGGEKIKKEGVWYFVDKEKGVYMNELPRVNCN